MEECRIAYIQFGPLEVVSASFGHPPASHPTVHRRRDRSLSQELPDPHYPGRREGPQRHLEGDLPVQHCRRIPLLGLLGSCRRLHRYRIARGARSIGLTVYLRQDIASLIAAQSRQLCRRKRAGFGLITTRLLTISDKPDCPVSRSASCSRNNPPGSQ